MSNRWDAREALNKWIERHVRTPTHSCVKLSHVKIHREGDEIPIEEIEAALIKAAKIVERHGTEYIAWFERIERELAMAKEREETLKRICNLAQDTGSLNPKSDTLQPRSFLLQAWAIAISNPAVLMSH